jgi:preprotein translocase subunit SecA
MVFGPQGPNVYGFESLSEWANKKYDADLSAERLQNLSPRALQEKLLELSKAHNNGRLKELIEEKVISLGNRGVIEWAEKRFETNIQVPDETSREQTVEIVLDAGRQFLRKELADLEKYVLLQIYDSTWKDHLYSMDHLKESIFTRVYAEKDPKIEYKQEGFRMFNEMLRAIEDRVTDTVFKVRLEAGARRRNVWNVSSAQHDEVSQFSMAERQRAAATAPQGERKVKQIKLEQPKVGRNEPCPCGSGKKYKKCCGKNA